MSEYVIDMSNSIYTSQDNLIHFDFSNIHEEIVRCRDCKHLNIVGKCPCGFWALENLNGFCAWGERRKKDESIETEDES